MAVVKKSPGPDAKPPATPVANFSKDEELAAYRSMLSIRRFEEKAGQMYFRRRPIRQASAPNGAGSTRRWGATPTSH